MMDWKKIFSNHVSDKGLASKVYKELLKHMSQTKNKNNSAIKEEIERNWWSQAEAFKIALSTVAIS